MLNTTLYKQEAAKKVRAVEESQAAEDITADAEAGAVAAEQDTVTEAAAESDTVPAIGEADARKAADPESTGYRSEINGVEVDFELQYRDRETDMKDIAKRVTEDYAKRGNDASRIELIQVYLKPTDFTAYYVINNSYEGKIPLF
ncbi:MAG: hypothetical protein K2K74_18315 [Lachnospiraceae bacterium]|nr:hypothetical protein [Lachnospiraceae bacterium]